MTTQAIFSEHLYKSSDGLSLYYRSYGSADRVLICIPGLTRNSKDFEKLASRYAANWRVITPDLRGRGQSDRDPVISNYQPLTYVSDIWKLVDDLEIQNFTILGTSLGGMIAMHMASGQEQRINGVIINDVGPVIPIEAVQRLMKYVGLIPPFPDWKSAAEFTQMAYVLTFPDQPESFWLRHAGLSMCETKQGTIVADSDTAIGKVLRKGYRMLKLVQFLRRFGLMRKTAALLEDGYWKQFTAMTMPTLLIRGASSDVLTVETMEKMKLIRPEMKTITVPKRGHAPLLDEPEALFAIDTFLGRIAN